MELSDLPRPTEIATPLFVLLILAEMLYARKNKSIHFYAKDTATSMLMGLGSVISGALFAFFIVEIAFWVYEYRLFHIEFGLWTFLLCFILDDLAYYFFHRLAHRVRWFWASHVVHHSSQHYNLSTALRQTWTGPLSLSFLFRTPLFFLGFPPEMVFFTSGINLIYQFWIHTETIGHMGPFEWIFNTPSHHRVHHATNAKYLDSNYAGALIIWDKMFGTFVAEDRNEPCQYGIINNLGTYNPFRVAFHEWISLGKDMGKAISQEKSLKHAVKFLFAPPGWCPSNPKLYGERQTSDQIKQAHKTMARNDMNE